MGDARQVDKKNSGQIAVPSHKWGHKVQVFSESLYC